MKFVSLGVAIILAVGIAFSVPTEVAAQGLVNCSGLDCNFCSLVNMANTIITWLITMLAVVAVLIFVVAGFRLVTSGGNPEAMKYFKSRLLYIFLGFLLVLTSWLIIDTLLERLTERGGLEFWGIVECGGMAESSLVAIEDPDFNYLNILAASPGWTRGFVAEGDTNNWVADCDYDCTDEELDCRQSAGIPMTDMSSSGTVTCRADQTRINTGTISASACAPLSSLTDPAALELENGSSVTYNGADPRLQQCALEQLGGSVESAYRPASYQRHLKEIHTKWCDQGLQNSRSSCSSVYDEVQREMTRHGLSCDRPVATNSNHSTGIAIDISGGPRRNTECFRWFGRDDDVHYTLIPGCSCN